MADIGEKSVNPEGRSLYHHIELFSLMMIASKITKYPTLQFRAPNPLRMNFCIMTISYQNLQNWLLHNWKRFLAIEILCLSNGFSYYYFAPKIYEANFGVRLPKTQIALTAEPNKTEWHLIISGIDFLRILQNPLGYGNELIRDCMGVDTNQNRKDWVNALNIGLKNRGDVIQFSIRLAGEGRTLQCAQLFEIEVMRDLTSYYESAIKQATIEGQLEKKIIQFEKPSVVGAIRLSDNFIQPNLKKTLIGALLLGLFLTVFFSALQKKYRH